jgi:hypothetical protein
VGVRSRCQPLNSIAKAAVAPKHQTRILEIRSPAADGASEHGPAKADKLAQSVGWLTVCADTRSAAVTAARATKVTARAMRSLLSLTVLPFDCIATELRPWSGRTRDDHIREGQVVEGFVAAVMMMAARAIRSLCLIVVLLR